jgi:hypothetical protein
MLVQVPLTIGVFPKLGNSTIIECPEMALIVHNGGLHTPNLIKSKSRDVIVSEFEQSLIESA